MIDQSINLKKSKSYLLRRKRGAVTLFLCFLLGSTSTILLICLQASILRRDEATIIRAGRSAAESCLAAYDIDLLEDYGIWAVESRFISDIASDEMLDDQVYRPVISISAANNALDNEWLSSQIAAYMKIRAPAIWIEKIAEALMDINAPIPTTESDIVTARSGSSHRDISVDRLKGTAGSNVFTAPLKPEINKLNDIDMDDIMDFQMKLQEYMFKCIPYNLALSAVNNCLDWIFSPITEPLKDAAAKKISSTIDEMLKDRLPVNPADFGVEDGAYDSGYLPDYLDPTELTELSGLADSLLNAPARANSLVLAEYCLAIFPSQVTETIDRETGSKNKILTPDGRSHDSLARRLLSTESGSAEFRKNELEMIITGLDSPQKAADRMKGNLMMVRSIIRIIEIASDQSKMNSYRPAANIMSALISAASAGTVNIDPETALWLIAVSDAVRSAAEDTKQLIDGKSVALWTYDKRSYIFFNYYDYMRLFLLISPDEKLLTNISNTIQRSLPGNYASSLETKISYGQRSCSFLSSYRVNNSHMLIEHDEAS